MFDGLFIQIPDPEAIGLVSLAYIDPGTGSYIIQVLIAGLLGGLLAIKMFWRRLAGWIQTLRGGSRK